MASMTQETDKKTSGGAWEVVRVVIHALRQQAEAAAAEAPATTPAKASSKAKKAS